MASRPKSWMGKPNSCTAKAGNSQNSVVAAGTSSICRVCCTATLKASIHSGGGFALPAYTALTTLNSGKWISHSLKKMANTVAAVHPMMAPLLVLFSNCAESHCQWPEPDRPGIAAGAAGLLPPCLQYLIGCRQSPRILGTLS